MRLVVSFKVLWLYTFSVLGTALILPAGAQVHHVDQNATGPTHDGSSWCSLPAKSENGWCAPLRAEAEPVDPHKSSTSLPCRKESYLRIGYGADPARSPIASAGSHPKDEDR